MNTSQFLPFVCSFFVFFVIQFGGGDEVRSAQQTFEFNRLNVKNGIDVLAEEGFASLKGRSIGLISNHTGRAISGKSTAELLLGAKNVQLKTLFSPEHGYAGMLDQAIIKGGVDQRTGLKIFSLYGKHRTPTDESLKGIDTLVFDIQDIGTRYYTYISTMGLAMRKASEKGLKFVVLDRPNPINGSIVQGPVLRLGEESFIGCHNIPIRHGMTVGELALMLKAEWKLDLDLRIVKMKNWNRQTYFDKTGQVWVNPSPNMRHLNQAILYPGIGILETTNLSVGRGTDRPFEFVGAPWIDSRRFARKLNQKNLPGVRFIPVEFTPNSSKYKGKRCGGISIVMTDRSKIHPLQVGFSIVKGLRDEYKDQWSTKSLNRLISNKPITEFLLSSKNWAEFQGKYEKQLQQFKSRRSKFLIYQ